MDNWKIESSFQNVPINRTSIETETWKWHKMWQQKSTHERNWWKRKIGICCCRGEQSILWKMNETRESSLFICTQNAICGERWPVCIHLFIDCIILPGRGKAFRGDVIELWTLEVYSTTRVMLDFYYYISRLGCRITQFLERLRVSNRYATTWVGRIQSFPRIFVLLRYVMSVAREWAFNNEFCSGLGGFGWCDSPLSPTLVSASTESVKHFWHSVRENLSKNVAGLNNNHGMAASLLLKLHLLMKRCDACDGSLRFCFVRLQPNAHLRTKYCPLGKAVGRAKTIRMPTRENTHRV